MVHPLPDLTVYMSCVVQVLQSLDMLRRTSKLNMSELESADCIGALHTLYSMTLTPIGKVKGREGCKCSTNLPKATQHNVFVCLFVFLSREVCCGSSSLSVGQRAYPPAFHRAQAAARPRHQAD